MIRVGTCVGAGLSVDGNAGSFSCTISESGLHELQYQLVGTTDWVTTGRFIEARSPELIDAPAVTTLVQTKFPGLNQPYSFSVLGSDLDQVDAIVVDDCNNALISYQFSDVLGVTCDGFNSLGSKGVSIDFTGAGGTETLPIGTIEFNRQTGLVAHYRFDGDLLDTSGFGHHGIANEQLTFGAGIIGDGVVLDGQDDFIEVLPSSLLDFSGLQPFTFSAWVIPDPAATYPASIVGKFNLGVRGEHLLQIDGNGKALALREVTPFNLRSDIGIAREELTHIVSAFDGSTLRLYVNGDLEGSVAMGSATQYVTSTLVGANLAQDNPVSFFDGMIDDLRIYDRALTDTEVGILYNTAFPILPFPIVLLNDTGITQGGNFSSPPSGTNPTCTGTVIGQQDCSIGPDSQTQSSDDGVASFSFTKLDSAGNELSNSAVEWTCLRDNVTGLFWENKSDDGGIRDKDNVYRWGGAGADPLSLLQGAVGDFFNDWDVLVNHANSQDMCGLSVWRVPSRQELIGLTYYGTTTPKIDTAVFPRMRAGFDQFNGSDKYWSVDTGLNGTTAYFANFYNADHGQSNRSSQNHVILVAGPPLQENGFSTLVDGQIQQCRSEVFMQASFLDNQDGTVSDVSTGLQWAKCSAGLTGNNCESGTIEELDWKEALEYAEVSTLAGHSDWRLPNVKELFSLVNQSCQNPSIDSQMFPNTGLDVYWTNSPWVNSVRNSAWGVRFQGGAATEQSVANGTYVRLVRS